MRADSGRRGGLGVRRRLCVRPDLQHEGRISDDQRLQSFHGELVQEGGRSQVGRPHPDFCGRPARQASAPDRRRSARHPGSVPDPSGLFLRHQPGFHGDRRARALRQRTAPVPRDQPSALPGQVHEARRGQGLRRKTSSGPAGTRRSRRWSLSGGWRTRRGARSASSPRRWNARRSTSSGRRGRRCRTPRCFPPCSER